MTLNDGDAPTAHIVAEIKLLRKGRGIRTRDLDQRIGSHLRELTGAATTDLADLRQSLAGELTTRAAALPDDLRMAALVSLGLWEETKHLPLFGDRVSWLAERADRNERTVLRRISAAEQLLAEEIAGELRRRSAGVPSADGWYLDEFRTVLRLDTPTPEAHERRRIVATRTGLRHVRASLDVPTDRDHPPMPLGAEVLCGGRLFRRAIPDSDRHEFVIELPTPLRAGETHEYELILRVPPGEQMRPHYIFTPEYRCNAFDLTVRFDVDRPPDWVRKVTRETVRTFDTPRLNGDQVQLNGAGEVHVRFDNPVLYLGYGLQWHY